MHQISLSKEKAAIDFNEFFYPKLLLQKSAEHFAKICPVKVMEAQGNRILVELSQAKNISAKELALGFCNRALELRQNWD